MLAGIGSSAAEAPPAWVQKGGSDPDAYPSIQYLVGYGLSSPGGTETGQRQQALGMAQEALAAAIRLRVTSEFTSQVTQLDQQMSRFAMNLIRTKADVELEGLDTILAWHDPKGKVTHALVVLDKPRALRILGEKLAQQALECAAVFYQAKADADARGFLRARHLRESLEECLVVRRVLGGGAGNPACPSNAEIDQELRRALIGRQTLDGLVASAALDLSSSLPRGIRVLLDRVTYADTPFCGSLSAFLEQALASELIAFGRVRMVDKTAGRDAIRAGGMDATLGETLHSQAVVGGACFDLGEEVQINLRVTAVSGDELASSTVKIPAALIRKAGLKLVPDNFLEAKKSLEICDAVVRASSLKVKLALDRGEGGIYRKGDRLFLFLKANMDCYVKVLYHQVDGTNVVIFPNSYHPDARIQKDHLYQIPPDDNSFELEVMEPFGVELVKVIASTSPMDLPALPPDANGLQTVRENLGALLGRVRGIVLKKAAVEYAEDTMVVNTVEAEKPARVKDTDHYPPPRRLPTTSASSFR
jgi:hypothetical protein